MIKTALFATTLAMVISPSSAASGGIGKKTPGIEKGVFGKTPDGTTIYLYTLKNSKGMEARITNYGGIVVSLLVPDRGGRLGDIVLGFDSLTGYIKESPYFGCIVGRYGNRIANGRFMLDGRKYALATNNGKNHLHGGRKGFDKAVWAAEVGSGPAGPSLVLNYLSKDGEEGYPGNLSVKVTYQLTDRNELKIDYRATTDKPTVVNLTHHSYFNLAGAGAGDILSHILNIGADRFTPVDSGLIPTGELRRVRGTPMDFTTPTAIGARIDRDDEQLHLGRGYDHNFVLRKKGNGLTLAAKVYERSSGRVMEVLTKEPGLQFYCGNFLDGHIVGKRGKRYDYRYGFCLETQHFPDSPNKPKFPTTVLRPGQTYTTTTIYKFSTDGKH